MTSLSKVLVGTAIDDTWRAEPGITFREHEGRGYWSGDRWTEW